MDHVAGENSFVKKIQKVVNLIRTSFDFSLGLKINKVVSVKHGGVPWSWGCYCNEKIFRVDFFNCLI